MPSSLGTASTATRPQIKGRKWMDGLYLLLIDSLITLLIVPTLTVLLVFSLQTLNDIINHSDAAWAQINSISSGFLQLTVATIPVLVSRCKTSSKMLQ